MGYSFIPLWLRIVEQRALLPALSDISHTLTYAELHTRASAIAEVLLKTDHQEQGVIVCMHDKLQSIVAFLGVLLAGKHYFFISPELLDGYLDQFPDLQQMAILTDQPLKTSITFTKSVVLYAEATASNFDYKVPAVPAPDSPFAIFSTSGSTGTPKLVIHNHAYLLTDILAQIEQFPIYETDKRDYFGSLMFSASIGAIYPILLAGGHLVLFDFQKHGALALPNLWEDSGITVTTLPTSVLRLLTKTTNLADRLPGLRILIVSGEAVSTEDLGLFFNRLPPDLILMNGYASTETRGITLASFRNKVKQDDPPGSVGRVWLEKRLLIVDENGQELKTGETGEIVVEAEGLPRGYLFRDSENQFSTTAGGIVRYNTGDVGFLDDSGYLYLTGRKDFIVKINGIKVNLLEIENALLQLPNVEECAVILDNQQRIRSFLTVADGFILENCQMQLKNTLTPNLLPASYTLLDELPKTITGKIDRVKLAEIDKQSSPEEIDYQAESISVTIGRIWQKELGLSYSVKPDDDFFKDLGGNSLLCALCTEILETSLGVRLDVNAMYTYTTPAALEQFILMLKNNLVVCVPINSHETGRPILYFIPPYPGDRRTYRFLEDALESSFNLFFLYYNPLKADQSIVPFNELVTALAAPIHAGPDVGIVGYSFGGMVAYFVCQELEYNKKPVESLILLDTPLYRQFTKIELGFNFSVRVARKFRQFLRRPDDIWIRFVVQFRKTYQDYSERFTEEKFKDDPFNPIQVVWHYIQSFPERKPLSSDIVLFRAKELPVAYQFKWDYNWKKYTKGKLHTYWLEGWHENAVNDPDNARTIAHHLNRKSVGINFSTQLKTDN